MYNIERLPGVIDIGKVGEKNFRTIEFDLSSWITEIPNGVPSLVVVRPGDSEDAAYIAATTFENNILTWIVSDSDTANDGAGTIQIWLEEFSDEDVTKRGKSAMTAIRVYESIASASSNGVDCQCEFECPGSADRMDGADDGPEDRDGRSEASRRDGTRISRDSPRRSGNRTDCRRGRSGCRRGRSG